MRIDLPTVDHGEMGQRDMLALASDGVHAFLNGQYSDTIVHQHAPDMTGSRLHHLLSGQTKPTPQELEKLLEHTSAYINADQLMALMHLNMLHGEQDRTPALIETVVHRNPQIRLIQYVNRRLQRHTSMLCPSDMPAFLPASLAAVDRALAIRQPRTMRPIPKPLRLICLTYDICCAVLIAQYHRSCC
jgi:hypothetical protein